MSPECSTDLCHVTSSPAGHALNAAVSTSVAGLGHDTVNKHQKQNRVNKVMHNVPRMSGVPCSCTEYAASYNGRSILSKLGKIRLA